MKDLQGYEASENRWSRDSPNCDNDRRLTDRPTDRASPMDKERVRSAYCKPDGSVYYNREDVRQRRPLTSRCGADAEKKRVRECLLAEPAEACLVSFYPGATTRKIGKAARGERGPECRQDVWQPRIGRGERQLCRSPGRARWKIAHVVFSVAARPAS